MEKTLRCGKSWSFQKLNKIDKSLSKLIKLKVMKERTKTPNNKIRDEKKNGLTHINEIQGLVENNFKNIFQEMESSRINK